MQQVSLATAIERIGVAVDLLKLDCEGAEWEILKSEGCWHVVRNIRMEIHFLQGKSVEDARAALERNGFQLIWLDVKNHEMATIWAAKADLAAFSGSLAQCVSQPRATGGTQHRLASR